MAVYTITFARSARKELELLDFPLRIRVFRRIELLASDPRPSRCRKLEGAEDLWRIRVGDYRIIYSVDDEKRIIDINAVRHRSAAYR
ncbi:MAG: type II toxin-antitoxin system RelE/ParE family toxin [Ignavibacteria bacterium]|nr:type II toxin-antitoxin system RelE/ParE family toxin [Ignavibacteria bacterium]